MTELSSDDRRVKVYKDKAIKELDLMHEAILIGDYKKAMHHKIVANIAIDEMTNATISADPKRNETRGT